MAKESHIKFKNTHKMQRRPIVVYADFECVTERIDDDEEGHNAYQHHIPCSYCAVETANCCGVPNTSEPSLYRGEDCVSRFLTEIVAIGTNHQERLNNPKPLDLSPAEEEEFQAATKCCICNERFLADGLDKARDHCHICGSFRGATHIKCNAAFRLDRDITVVFHNLRRYDGHLLMQQIGQTCELFGLKLTCIPKTLEDYLTFTLTNPANREEGSEAWRIRFIDSYQFLTASLNELVKGLPKDRFNAIRQAFKDPQLIELLIRKGVYPYDYMDTFSKFDDAQLPTHDQFYNLLTDSNITDDDYLHAKKVWEAFSISNMGEYHDLYLLTDVLLLHDVFEAFRELALEKYGLDPTHYITLPSLAWDCCLKLTKVELETITEPTTYHLIEQGLRGGISVVSKRYAKANNNQCEDYDETAPHSYIMYLDANNLYGWAMSQKLPTHGFRWLSQEEIDELNFSGVDANDELGYIIEVDLAYPEDLHDLHSQYPLAAEKMVVPEEFLSPFCKDIRSEKERKAVAVEKLLPNLQDKVRYVIHSRMLRVCLELGLELRKVHRGLVFNQSAWIEPYIRLNTELRRQASTDFEKSLFKLMNNAVFGKTMENTRLYKTISLATTMRQVKKMVASPRYKNHIIFNENLAAIAMQRRTLRLDKPIYVGFSILDISKILMVDFHYRYMMPKYGGNLELLFTDTDSFIYLIHADNVYDDMQSDLDIYDTSDYPKDHMLYSEANKKVIGKMKDEMSGRAISAFVGLKPKMYSFICDGKEKKRAKGIKKSTVERHITFDQYYKCVMHHSRYKHEMRLIKSHEHEIYSILLNKTSLTPFDSKRYILENGIDTLAYGHYRIKMMPGSTNTSSNESMDWESPIPRDQENTMDWNNISNETSNEEPMDTHVQETHVDNTHMEQD